MKLLAALLLPGILALAFAYAAVRLVGGALPSTEPRAQGIPWGAYTFEDRAALARWLRSRGVNYQAWARRHPAPVRGRAERPSAARETDDRAGSGRWVALGASALVAAVLLFLLRRRRVWRPKRRRARLGARSWVLLAHACGAAVRTYRLRVHVRQSVVAAGHVLAISCSRARWTTAVTMRRHVDLVWYFAGAALVAGAALAVAGWT